MKMVNEPIKITDLESLRREKERLKLYCSYQEDLLKEKMDYAKNNAHQIIGRYLLPFDSDKNEKINDALDWVNGFVLGKFFKSSSPEKGKLSEALVKIGEVVAIRLVNRFLKKR